MCFCESRHDSKWHSADYYKYDWEYSGDNQYDRELNIVPIYSDRCYPLFGLLAGVRCDWFSPIYPPRGIPDDISAPLRKEYETQCAYAHTYSWYTLKELMDWRDGRCNFSSDCISDDQRDALDVLGISYWQWQECLNNIGTGLDEGDWKDVINALDKLIDAMKERACEEFWIYDFYGEEIKKEEIRKIANDFRIVFWFDS